MNALTEIFYIIRRIFKPIRKGWLWIKDFKRFRFGFGKRYSKNGIFFWDDFDGRYTHEILGVM